jgi:glutaredoxin
MLMTRHTIARLLGCAALLCATGSLQAQTIYRIVGSDGKVTFSDKPPVSADQGKVASTGVGAKTDSTGSAMPFELRQVVSKYPVCSVHHGKNARHVTPGRLFLTARGVPFNERTVSTEEDLDYLQRLSGDKSLPYLTIGTQRIKGMSDLEWGPISGCSRLPREVCPFCDL